MKQDEIFAKTCSSIATVLDIDDITSIKMEDRLVLDLGADSLDLLDLIFHLEQHFKVRINPRDFEKEAQVKLGDTPIERDGVYTAQALGELRKALPEVPPQELHENFETKYLPRVFRVETFVRLVARMMEEQNVE
jgi:acyl carrier protein